MKGSLRQKIMLIITHRYVLVMINILLLSIVIAIIIEMFDLFRTPENDINEMMDMCDGIAMMLYGYGVTLKVRDELMKYSRLYPEFETRLQTRTDALCRKYGIYFPLLGLVQEILVRLMIIPSRVLNTHGKELYIFSICLFVQIIVSVLILKSSYHLVQLAFKEKPKTN